MIIIITVVVKITQSTWFPHLIQKKWKDDQEKIEHHKTLRDQVIIYHLRGRGSCKDHAEEGESLDYRGGEGGGNQENFNVSHVQSRSSDEKFDNLFHFSKEPFWWTISQNCTKKSYRFAFFENLKFTLTQLDCRPSSFPFVLWWALWALELIVLCIFLTVL